MSKIIPFHEPDGSHEDPRPLPFIVADMFGFSMQSHDLESGVVYSVQDWIAGIASTDTKTAANHWQKMKSQTVNAIHSLPYSASDGKQYTRDYVNDKELYRIAAFMKATKTRPALKTVKEYLAEAGAFADLARREPETIEGMLSEQRRKKYLRDGRENVWVAIREMGISTRKQVMALVKHLLGGKADDFFYRSLTNETYRGLFDKSAAEIREHIGIPKDANLREFMSALGLSFVFQAEAMIAAELSSYAPDDVVSESDVRKVFRTLSDFVGGYVEATEKQLGRDVITGRKLLPSGDEDTIA